MLLRILTAAVLIPVVVLLVWFGPPLLLAAVAAVVAILALLEFFHLGDRYGIGAFRKWTLVCSALVFYAQYSAGLVQSRSFGVDVVLLHRTAIIPVSLSLEAVALIFLFGCVAIGLATHRPLHDVLPASAVSAAGILFVVFPFSYLVRINEIERVGRHLVLFTLVLVWAGDMLAYFVGRFFGHVPLAPALSPKKTWEGALGNVAASLLVGVFFARWMEVDAVTLIVIAALANIAGQAGDLIESAWKRGAAVKDSGTLLPGHGGMLDRIDSLILASPVVWALYVWIAMPR
ncbi:MAG: phosphatidate cytidylyltransferase [Candidatus Acidiferrales bacterium]